jgi:hypothetical protein
VVEIIASVIMGTSLYSRSIVSIVSIVSRTPKPLLHRCFLADDKTGVVVFSSSAYRQRLTMLTIG